MKAIATALIAGAALWTSTGFAQPTAPPPPGETQETPVDHRVEMWRAEIGYRGSFVTDAGYGPFSTQQYFSQASFLASRTVWEERGLSFAPGVGLDFGSSSATARGQSTSLSMTRVSVPLEGRAHFGPWGYAFVRVAPGVALEDAEVDDASAPGALKSSAWMFSTDVSAGYAWLVAPRFERTVHKARFWLQADVGYGWVAGDRLALAATGAGSTNASGVDLGTLTMDGPFFRVALAASF